MLLKFLLVVLMFALQVLNKIASVERLRVLSATRNRAQHRLKQDEPTRWNSTLYMLQTIKEQTMALAAHATEYAILQLTPNQLDLTSKIIAALHPIEKITKSVSTDASASLIIPFIRILRRTLEDHEDDCGIRTMKREMLSSLNRRYIAVEANAPLVLATILDPRFEDKFFSGATERANARELLEAKVTAITATQPSQAPEPPPKRARTVTLNCLLEILEAGATVSNVSSSEGGRYLAEPLIPFHRANSYSWWAENRVRFPLLAKLAQRYLSAPPTSVPSERLFSGAGDVYDEKRNRLAPERAEMLLFIKSNSPLICGNYQY